MIQQDQHTIPWPKFFLPPLFGWYFDNNNYFCVQTRFTTDIKMPRLCLETSLRSLQGSISNPNDIFDIVRGIQCEFQMVKRCKHIQLQIFVRNLFSFMRVYLSIKIHVSWIFTFIDFNCIFFYKYVHFD